MSLDPTKLVLPPIVYNGEKSGFLRFKRAVFQTAIAHKINHFLLLPEPQAILALAKDLTPLNFEDPEEAKEPSQDATAKATAWHGIASPIAASWLEDAVKDAKPYENLLLDVPLGDAHATWTVIASLVPTTKHEATTECFSASYTCTEA